MPFETLGMIETEGLIEAVELSDAIVKTANVASIVSGRTSRHRFRVR